MNMRLGYIYNIIFFRETWPVESKMPKKLQNRCCWQFCINNDVTEADRNSLFFVETDRNDTWDHSSKVCRDS